MSKPESSGANRLVARLTLEVASVKRENAELRRLWTMSQELAHATHVRLLALCAERDEIELCLEAARRELRLLIGPFALARESV